MKTILGTTNQIWKMNAFYLSLTVAAIFMFGGSYLGKALSISQPVYINISGVFIGLVSFLIACLSIKCPNCKDKWFWRAVSKSESGAWLFWFKSQLSCPVCKQGASNQD